jgi:hypothetical protein
MKNLILVESNCLWYALHMWHKVGGRLGFVTSTHWCIPHVQHHDKNEVLTQFVPPHDLKSTWHSLFGFKGFVELGDSSAHKRKTMTLFGSFIGVLIILIFGFVWYAQQLFRRSEPYYPEPVKMTD